MSVVDQRMCNMGLIITSEQLFSFAMIRNINTKDKVTLLRCFIYSQDKSATFVWARQMTGSNQIEIFYFSATKLLHDVFATNQTGT